MDSDEDADLALALALSAQEAEAEAAARKGSTSNKKVKATTTKKQEQEVVVISSDEDEDEIVEVSKRGSKTKEEAVIIPKPGAGPLSFLGDRAQMERERLARQKRVRGPSPPPKSRSNSSANSDQDEEEDESGSEGSARKRVRLNPPPSLNSIARTFPIGALLRIDTQHADPSIPNKPDCIRLSEVLGPKDELSFAILSAFVVDAPWLYSFFARDTPVVLVTDANTSGAGAELGDVPTLKNIFPGWVRVCPPLPAVRGGYSGCMHMKFMLLFKKSGGLRVVVSSANLVPHDWRDVENYLFVQDIPPAAPGTTRTTPPAGVGEKPGESFPAMLARALRSVGVEEALAIMGRQGHTTLPLPTLLPSALSSSKSSNRFPAKHAKHAPAPSPLETRWDWRKVRAALVPSVAGRWEGWTGEEGVLWTGQPRLMRAVQGLGCGLEDLEAGAFDVKGGKGKGKAGGSRKNGKGKGKEKGGKWAMELDCLTSSIGTYTLPWLAVFRLCAAGRATALQAWLDRGRKKTPPQGPTRVLFPTLETVRGTVLGEGGAGTVFCRRAQWTKIGTLVADANTGLEMRDARSRSGGVGMHTKMILGTLLPPPAPESDPEATESDTESEPESSSDVEIVEVDEAGNSVEVEGAGGKGRGRGRPHAWLYMGSHNFTPSAWGTLSGSGFQPVLTVANYELGVVMRLDTEEEVEGAVAWERPARRYGKGDVPWIQAESPFFQ
ncbi:hypothetical protein K438DRAFT_2015408 [Mycena galopus ATCC 62051]|nr:hypothetical protein K438DRAFT_2015408 [Mycena galopus ATCC 62051]